MKRFYRIAAAIILAATWGTFSVAQAGHSSYDPDTHSASSKPSDGFLDFTLRRLNPSDTDYGQCLGEDRRILMEETLRNAYFWSNIVALVGLDWLFLVIVCQHKIQIRREWTTAEIVSQLEQALKRSGAQLTEATKKNVELKDALAALKESALRSTSLPPGSCQRAGSSTNKCQPTNNPPVASAVSKANSAKPTTGANGRSATGKEPAGQMRLFTPDADFIMKLNSLEQQLAQSREDNKQLRRRIAVGDRRLEVEPAKNRQLEDA
jgi:hypothetical protein